MQAILRPFMVFSVVGLALLGLFSEVRGSRFIERFDDGLLVLYLLSIVVLFLGALIQCALRQWRAAKWTFGFVVFDILVFLFNQPALSRA